MWRRIARLSTASACAGLALHASAAAPVAAGSRHEWTGFYAGANGGYGWSSGTADPGPGSLSDAGLFPAETPFILAAQVATLAPLGLGADGALGGVQAGYNLRLGQLLLGLEADFDLAGITGRSSRTSHGEFNIPVNPGFGVTTTASVRKRLDSIGTLRARLGFTAADDLMLYATGGLAFGRVSASTTVDQVETGPTPCIRFSSAHGSASATRVGWTIGAGGEWAFQPGFTAKLEWLHYDLGSERYDAGRIADTSCPPPTNPPLTQFASVGLSPRAEFRGELVRLGLNMKLGNP